MYFRRGLDILPVGVRLDDWFKDLSVVLHCFNSYE